MSRSDILKEKFGFTKKEAENLICQRVLEIRKNQREKGIEETLVGCENDGEE